MKTFRTITFCLGVLGCATTFAESQRDYYAEMMTPPNDDMTRAAYIRSLTTNEVWILANQACANGWSSEIVGGGILAPFFGANWQPSFPEFRQIITDKSRNSALRGSLAISGFEFQSKAWAIQDRLQYFDDVFPLFDDQNVPDFDKVRIAESSYRTFSSVLSEIQELPDVDDQKNILLNACHKQAQRTMRAVTKIVEENIQKQTANAPAKSIVRTLENYVNTYEVGNYPKTVQFQEAVDEATKARSLLHNIPGSAP